MRQKHPSTSLRKFDEETLFRDKPLHGFQWIGFAIVITQEMPRGAGCASRSRPATLFRLHGDGKASPHVNP
jgi:hypothetical protein